MLMPGRKYSNGNQYRYGFNGQEKSDDVTAGNYTALFWEYDSRTGRRWNLDPVLKVGESPYSALSNNPIWRSDPNGDTDSTGNSVKPIGPGPKTPMFSIRIGGTGGPWGSNATTSIFRLYGNKTYYNSSPNGTSATGQSEFKIDEPNSFIQLQFRVGGQSSNMQIGLNWFKQKFRDNTTDGFGYEVPTAVQGSFAINNNLTSVGKKFNISSNLSFGAGIELGVPRNQINSSITFDSKKLLGTNYSIIGVGVSAIYRVDAIYSKHWTTFIAGTIHHIQTFDQKPSIGTFSGQAIGSLAISAGIGYNISR